MMWAGNGLVTMTPSSISHVGTSASINSNGGVSFTGITSLSLNGVFTNNFDNYIVVLNGSTSSPFTYSWRYRSNGTDNTSTSYTVQRFDINGTGRQSSRATLNYTNFAPMNNTLAVNGYITHVYGPYLTQPTAHRVISQYSENNVQYYDTVTTHSGSISFDGFTIYTGSSSGSGVINVFGYEE